MRRELYAPFYETGRMVEESVVLVEGEGLPRGRLMFCPLEVEEVKSFDDSVVFPADSYKVEGDEIISLGGLPFMPEPLTRGEGAEKEGLSTMDGLVFTETQGLVKYQIKVTYTFDKAAFFSQNPAFPVPAFKGDKLKNFNARAREGDEIGILLYGDSIAAGCHASSVLGYPPYLPTWGEAFTELVGEKFLKPAYLTNISVGGYTSRQGVENLAERLAPVDKKIDLILLNFGMNDGSWKIPAEEYRRNIVSIIEGIREKVGDADVAIISNLLANPLCSQDKELTSSYLSEDLALEEELAGVVTVDMTTLIKEIFKKKKGLDVYANDINHPTDFLVRLYVTYLYKTILGGKL